MTSQDLNSLKVSRDRLLTDLHYTCQWGTGKRWGENTTDTGMRRLALSDTDKQARDWFVETTKAAGCTVTIDAMGNIFAVRPGKRSGPPTFAGSHLDTQPSGGRYDGILGVHAAVEMLHVLNENHIETEFPIGVVNWTNEEGARFPISMVSSGVWAGQIPLATAHDLVEVTPPRTETLSAALARIGYNGPTEVSHTAIPMAAHFELHIEQGPILESWNRKIGIVTAVQAYRWFTLDVRGRDAHTGTTPLSARADALLTAAKMILHSHRIATKLGCVASTGILTLEPGSTNTIPGHVRFSLDIRARNDGILDKAEEALRRDFAVIAAGEDVGGLNDGATPGKACQVEWRTDSVSSEIDFHPDCIKCVTESAEGVFGAQAKELTAEMVSGAGHDSVYTSKVCPTSMIFIPCKNGVSHNPEEYSTPEDCALGAQVLLGAVLRYDRLRAEKAGREY
ncbi:amidase [Trichodelitschia bisporula]|uniref:Amidase n=1 Tax=Trichodelitschia bisporula TaxID=703511 RepID=A0A6G1I9M7_9PEZI|nr:amidase [Trichodelitschia bisporula]